MSAGDAEKHENERQEELFAPDTMVPVPKRRQVKSARGSWSKKVALDPRHRPQSYDRPSSTVRRQWARSPQESFILDAAKRRYRRLAVDEIAVLQGFDPNWFAVPGITRWNAVSAIGDSVPPPLALAATTAILEVGLSSGNSVEICAGAGGLASASSALGLDHLALVEHWHPAIEILRHAKPWSPEAVREDDALTFDLGVTARVGLLSGGPPCQPWSIGGRRQGHDDERDLLADIHHLVARLAPEAFLFENVPGLVSGDAAPYLAQVLENLRGTTGAVRYGVAVGVFDAADFGVPQRRKRAFIVGLRGRPNSAAYRVLDRVHQLRTHCSPDAPEGGLLPWVTVGEAIRQLPDPGGWKTWTHDGGIDDASIED